MAMNRNFIESKVVILWKRGIEEIELEEIQLTTETRRTLSFTEKYILSWRTLRGCFLADFA
jgi:hypothetical protein